MSALKSLDIEKVALAIEADAGQPLPELRKSLSEAKAIADPAFGTVAGGELACSVESVARE